MGQIVLTTFILNLRHFLMSASLSQKFRENIPSSWLVFLSFGITDETFSVASLKQKEGLGPGYMLGLNLISYFAWISGTAVGHVMGASLPQLIKSSMGIALYAMFIGLLVPGIRESRPGIFVAILAILISSILYLLSNHISISEGWSIILVTIISSLIGALIYPEGVDQDG